MNATTADGWRGCVRYELGADVSPVFRLPPRFNGRLHEEGGKIAWEGRVMMNAAITPDLLVRGLARFREPLGANLRSTLVDRAADRLVSVRDSQGGTSSPPVYVGRG